MPSNFMERRDVIPLAIIPHFVRGNLAPVPFVDESVVEHIDVLRAGFAQGPQNSFEPVGSREEEVVVELRDQRPATWTQLGREQVTFHLIRLVQSCSFGENQDAKITYVVLGEGDEVVGEVDLVPVKIPSQKQEVEGDHAHVEDRD